MGRPDMSSKFIEVSLSGTLVEVRVGVRVRVRVRARVRVRMRMRVRVSVRVGTLVEPLRWS